MYLKETEQQEKYKFKSIGYGTFFKIYLALIQGFYLKLILHSTLYLYTQHQKRNFTYLKAAKNFFFFSTIDIRFIM